MDKFVPKEYIEKFIPTNRSEKTQMEVFFEFISAQIFNNEEYTVEDFVYLNNDDLLESLKYYIKCNKVTAKGEVYTWQSPLFLRMWDLIVNNSSLTKN